MSVDSFSSDRIVILNAHATFARPYTLNLLTRSSAVLANAADNFSFDLINVANDHDVLARACASLTRRSAAPPPSPMP